VERIWFWTDAPPKRESSHGNHGVASFLISVLSDKIETVLTRRYHRSFARTDIIGSCSGRDVFFYPDASVTGLRRFCAPLAAALDVILFALWLPILCRRARKSSATKCFILCGADAWFLINIYLFQRFVPLATEIYLVDDIEASATFGHNRVLSPYTRSLLQVVIRQSDGVHAIAPGFVEHLDARFGCRAEWLPLPSLIPPPSTPALLQGGSHQRSIVFIGGLNHLYVDALRDLYEEICQFNSDARNNAPLMLKIISYGDVEGFMKTLANKKYVEGYRSLSNESMHTHLANAYACLLPYSFLPAEKLMVSTSFSCKILEYFPTGRPILVYGPSYASIPRYFRENGLPLCATSRDELRVCLREIETHQGPELIRQYRDVWGKYHSPNAVRKRLLGKED
jgi:hypothetical protein